MTHDEALRTESRVLAKGLTNKRGQQPPEISDMIHTIASQDDITTRKLLAGSLNLYSRAMQGRLDKFWKEDDVSNLFIILNILQSTYNGQIPSDLDTPLTGTGRPTDEDNHPADLPQVIREMAGSPRGP